ncbi:ATP-binding protein [Acetobacter orleanensis]|uniref:Uncharacterized protein n=1 Tax=Acetobacter orleanensis TaxID=104099 RepID=A0A4Y3TNM6_9PROT|nr:hypothetical protein [Acetobacter orleanensis]GAN68858.1 hypothetical protein Abol_023_010 [Acetobacter orleanensis JCM 7639]GBR25675.1 hypothetical protein AA0473_0953 [Acetobacter orleanensis NRIC 0473]GEB83384.1 hypothetical protein AOR01nite_18610 [Acetobacter orleanensis]
MRGFYSVAERTDGAITVTLRDNGTRLDPVLHDQIFYPLIAFKENGNAMGLILAR